MSIKQLSPDNLKEVINIESFQEIDSIPDNFIQNYELESKIKLYAPNDYWEASEDTKKEICNGCGAKGGIKVPNTFYGLCIREACSIHDWMYHTGKTKADKLFADAIFRLNLTILIDTHNEINGNFINSILTPLRHSRAAKYYFAVVQWGEKAYWVNKNSQYSIIEVENLKRDLNITFKGKFKSVDI